MADLGTLPSTRILANSPGSTQNRRRGGFAGGWGRSGSTQQQTPQPGGAAPQPQTFAQMQQAGLARPAPPPPGGAPTMTSYQGSAQPTAGPSSFQAPQQQLSAAPTAAPRMMSASMMSAPTSFGAPDVGSQYTQSVSNALNAPSRYDLPQVQQVRDALTAQLQQQFGGDARRLDEQMAQRGLSASSLGGGYQGDLKAAQATALANLNAQLIQGQAATSAGDLAASLGAGAQWQQQQNQGSQFQQSLAQQQLENQQQFGLAQGQLTGTYGGQQTLGGAQQALAAQLGLGNLNLGQQSLAQQGSQFGQTFGQQQLENTQQYGLAQAQQALAQQLGLGNLGVSQQQVANQQNQFGQSFGQQQLENTQQYGLAQAQQALAQQLGVGNLGVSQQQVANQANQFQQSQAQQAGQFGQTLSQQYQQMTAEQNFQNAQLAQKSLADQAAATGFWNGSQPTLAYQQQQLQQQQFNTDQANQMAIARMQDTTNLAGVNVQRDVANNQMNQFLAQWLAAQGYPKLPAAH